MSAEALANFLESENIEYRQNEPMRAHTTFKIGGEADIFIILPPRLFQPLKNALSLKFRISFWATAATFWCPTAE